MWRFGTPGQDFADPDCESPVLQSSCHALVQFEPVFKSEDAFYRVITGNLITAHLTWCCERCAIQVRKGCFCFNQVPHVLGFPSMLKKDVLGVEFSPLGRETHLDTSVLLLLLYIFCITSTRAIIQYASIFNISIPVQVVLVP